MGNQSDKSKQSDEIFVFDPIGVEKKLSSWFPKLAPETIKKLVTYQSELLKFNKAINLISANTVKNAESVHIADSVFACQLIFTQLVPSSMKIFDFGSGNGLPGVIFAILFPQVEVVLVDRDSRKLEFCKHVATVIGLKNLSTMTESVENLPAGSIVNVMARGFAPMGKAILVSRKQVKKGGRFFHLKGDGWASEVAQIPSQLFSFWSPSLLGQYRIPEANSTMAVVLTEKLAD